MEIGFVGLGAMGLPMASLLRDRSLHALAMGREELDWSAVALGAAEDAGLNG